MEKRTEFPALEARKSDLEHQHYEAKRQVADGGFVGKLDPAVLAWLATIRAELDELSYVLRIVSQERIDVPSRYTLIGGIAFIVILAAQVALLWWLGAGH